MSIVLSQVLQVLSSINLKTVIFFNIYIHGKSHHHIIHSIPKTITAPQQEQKTA